MGCKKVKNFFFGKNLKNLSLLQNLMPGWSHGARECTLKNLKNSISNVLKRISRTKNEIAVPASLHSIRELSAKEKNRRRIEEQREAQHFEYVKRSGSLKHAEIRPQRSAYQGIRYGLYISLNSLNHTMANRILY